MTPLIGRDETAARADADQWLAEIVGEHPRLKAHPVTMLQGAHIEAGMVDWLAVLALSEAP